MQQSNSEIQNLDKNADRGTQRETKFRKYILEIIPSSKAKIVRKIRPHSVLVEKNPRVRKETVLSPDPIRRNPPRVPKTN